MRALAAFALLCGTSFWLQGCGNAAETTPEPEYYSTDDPADTTMSTTVTTTLHSKNIWEFRIDMPLGNQTTHDLTDDVNGNAHPSFYEGCWIDPTNVKMLAGGDKNGFFEDWDDQFWEDGQHYGTYDGETGVTLFDKRNLSYQAGCLMRKTRLPIDLTKIVRLELDIRTSNDGRPEAPWYSVWLSPMITNTVGKVEKDAEIDIIENNSPGPMWEPVNSVHTAFSMCGSGSVPDSKPYCGQSDWDVNANAVDHHITILVLGEEGERIVRVCRCSGTGQETCPDDQLEGPGCVDIQADRGGREYGFRIWNDEAGAWKGHYWLVADIWKTHGNDGFRMSVGNVTFWKKNGTRWFMPMDGKPPIPDWSKDPSDPTV